MVAYEVSEYLNGVYIYSTGPGHMTCLQTAVIASITYLLANTLRNHSLFKAKNSVVLRTYTL
jgi:hypothetical protein